MNLSLSSRNLMIGLLAAFCACLITTGCNRGPKSAAGFRLPDGNPDRGKQAFIDLKCVSCHSVESVDFSTNDFKGRFNIVLGGETLRVRTYGELVTSIINPSHVILPKYKEQLKLEGKLSSMPDFNKLMTVEQMIDLVAFLQKHYRLPPPDVVIAY